jgi:hypothetical protein
MKIRRQSRIPGERRESTGASVKKEIKRAIEHTARKFRCSKSLVQNVAFGEFFGIDVEKLYEEEEKPKRRGKIVRFRRTA